MNKVAIVACVILAVIQIAVPLKMIQDHQNLLENGDEFIVEMQAVWVDQLTDMEELRIDINQNRIDLVEGASFRDGQTIFVRFEEDDDGVFSPVEIKEKRPRISHYLPARISYIDRDSSTASVRFPNMIYYVDRSRLQPNLNTTETRKAYPEPRFLAHGKIRNGHIAITKVTVDGKDIEEYYNAVR